MICKISQRCLQFCYSFFVIPTERRSEWRDPLYAQIQAAPILRLHHGE